MIAVLDSRLTAVLEGEFLLNFLAGTSNEALGFRIERFAVVFFPAFFDGEGVTDTLFDLRVFAARREQQYNNDPAEQNPNPEGNF